MANPNFDPIARPYRWMEYATFGPFLSQCRLAHIAEMNDIRHALLLGDGDGRFLAQLLRMHPLVTVEAVDSSRSMLKILDRRISRMGMSFQQRVHLHHADVLRWTASGKYDLVISHFFLDCFFEHQLEELFDRISPHLASGARWVISEFSVPRAAPGCYVAAGVVRFLYQSFGILTGLKVRRLPDFASAMYRRGFQLSSKRVLLGGLLQSQLWFLPA